MDIKFVTPTQTVEVTYEGQKRRFSVGHVSTKKDQSDGRVEHLTADLQGLSMHTRLHLWIVGWDTEVVLDDGDSHQADAMSPNPVCSVSLTISTPLIPRLPSYLTIRSLKVARLEMHMHLWVVWKGRLLRFGI